MDSLLEKVPGPAMGYVSVILGELGLFLAYLHFPGYSFLHNMMSELGVGPGAIFFNWALIISGILAMPFYFHFSRSFEREGNERLIQGALICSWTSCIFYALVGVFPAIKENALIHLLHGTTAAISLMSGMGYLIFFGVLIWRTKQYHSLQAIYSFIVAGIYLLFLLTWLPIVEWTSNFAITFWILMNATVMVVSKKKQELVP